MRDNAIYTHMGKGKVNTIERTPDPGEPWHLGGDATQNGSLFIQDAGLDHSAVYYCAAGEAWWQKSPLNFTKTQHNIFTILFSISYRYHIYIIHKICNSVFVCFIISPIQQGIVLDTIYKTKITTYMSKERKSSSLLPLNQLLCTEMVCLHHIFFLFKPHSSQLSHELILIKNTDSDTALTAPADLQNRNGS